MVPVLLAALFSAASPSAGAGLSAEVLAAKKKAKPKPAPTPATKAPAIDTSEGLDLTKPESTSAAEPPPTVEVATPAEEAAPPPKPAPPTWSLVTPHTAGESANLLEGGVGWPGVYAGYWRGLLSQLDVGARVGFNWGYEGLLTRPLPGLRFQLQARALLWDNGSLSLGVGFAPGVLVYFFPGSGARAGLTFPVAATLGLPNFVNKLNLSVTLEVPFWVMFGVGAVVPVMAGANAEYFLTESLLAFVRLKPLGVAVWTNGAGAFYAFEALAGVSLHL